MTRRPMTRQAIASTSCVEQALVPKRRGKTRRRLLVLATCLTVFIAGAPVADAADDPQPVEWPRAEAPSTDAKSDPTPVDWPRPQQF